MKIDPAVIVAVGRLPVPLHNLRNKLFKLRQLLEHELVDWRAVLLVQDLDSFPSRDVGATVCVKACSQLAGIKPKCTFFFFPVFKQHLREKIKNGRSISGWRGLDTLEDL